MEPLLEWEEQIQCIQSVLDDYTMSYILVISMLLFISKPLEKANPQTQNCKKVSQDVHIVTQREELITQDTLLADLGITVEPLP